MYMSDLLIDWYSTKKKSVKCFKDNDLDKIKDFVQWFGQIDAAEYSKGNSTNFFFFKADTPKNRVLLDFSGSG